MKAQTQQNRPKTYKGPDLKYYDADFFNWTMDKTGSDRMNIWIQDVDAVIRDRSGNMRMLEIKRNGYEPKPYQVRNQLILDAVIRAGVEALGGLVRIEPYGRPEHHHIAWNGYDLLQLSGTSFYSSDFVWNGQGVTGDELADLIRFGQ